VELGTVKVDAFFSDTSHQTLQAARNSRFRDILGSGDVIICLENHSYESDAIVPADLLRFFVANPSRSLRVAVQLTDGEERIFTLSETSRICELRSHIQESQTFVVCAGNFVLGDQTFICSVAFVPGFKCLSVRLVRRMWDVFVCDVQFRFVLPRGICDDEVRQMITARFDFENAVPEISIHGESLQQYVFRKFQDYDHALLTVHAPRAWQRISVAGCERRLPLTATVGDLYESIGDDRVELSYDGSVFTNRNARLCDVIVGTTPVCAGRCASPVVCHIVMLDESLKEMAFPRSATVADALDCCALDPAKQWALGNSESVLFRPEALLETLPEPRDLWIIELVQLEVVIAGSDRIAMRLPHTLTVDDVFQELGPRGSGLRLMTESGQVIEHDVVLSQLASRKLVLRQPAGPGRAYRFVWGDETADLAIQNGQRVNEAKVVVADYWNTEAGLVTLLYLGKQLKDRMIISSLRIPPDGHIAVYIREMRSIYLRSCIDIGRIGGQAEQPPHPDNYDEMLDLLVADTGKDRIMCARCFKFYEYDFERARTELQANE
jgi:hypothetical protein